MGLRITAYRGVIQASDPALHDAKWFRELEWTPGKLAPLDPRKAYVAREKVRVYDGSSGSWGTWRYHLGVLAGYPITEHRSAATSGKGPWLDYVALERDPRRHERPFYDLIYHSDCDGSIGPAACARLFKHFTEWSARAREHTKASDYLGALGWFAQYTAFRLTLASNDVVLDFT